MPSLILSSDDPAAIDVDVVVVGLYKGENGPSLAPGAESLEAAWKDESLAETFALMGATGDAESVTQLPSAGKATAKIVAGVGLGKKPRRGGAADAETLRRAAGAAARAAAGKDSLAFAIAADGDALGLGALLGAYQFAGYKTGKNSNGRQPVGSIALTGASADAARLESVVAGVSACRDWVNTAPNLLRPPAFADDVAKAASAAGLDVEVLDENALADGGYGGILAVGSGSAAKPRLVRLSYRAEGAARHVALVGKGITFDTGGISIKPGQGMWDMKTDMAGAAAVAGAMLIVAAIKPKVDVTAYLPMAENMVSSTAYRPGDVVTSYSGKTIEVINTDQEGRMVLCDALARAAEDSPDVIYETSTLTGGQVTALGKRIAGVMGDDAECERVKAAAERVGEKAWPMPMPEEIRKTFKSSVADTLQGSANLERSGHMLQGAIFLENFVPDDLPWAHIDIAGPANHGGSPYGYIPKGATGTPVRTLVELVEEHAGS
ncbi:MAG: leucyl aminopeptidase [Stackebrandtia sp.]